MFHYTCLPRAMLISLLGPGPVGRICFVKLTLSLMSHDPKMLIYVISKVLTAQIIFLLYLISLGQCNQNILALSASEVWRIPGPEMFTDFGWSEPSGHLPHFTYLDWPTYLLHAKNVLSSVSVLYCHKKKTVNDLVSDNLRFKHHSPGMPL